MIDLNGRIYMREIYHGEILNITSFKNGFVFAALAQNNDGKVTANFYGYDAVNDHFSRIKKSIFLKIKFGYEYEDIAKQLGDYVSCDAGFLSDGRVMVVFPNGEYHIFNTDGSVNVSSLLTYKGKSVCDIACQDNFIWCAVPEANAVIKYNPREGRIVLRAGGGEDSAFDSPCSVTLLGNKLYICNRGSRKIRTLDTASNTVRDYRVFNQKVFKYINVRGKEFVWLQSGLFVLD